MGVIVLEEGLELTTSTLWCTEPKKMLAFACFAAKIMAVACGEEAEQANLVHSHCTASLTIICTI